MRQGSPRREIPADFWNGKENLTLFGWSPHPAPKRTFAMGSQCFSSRKRLGVIFQKQTEIPSMLRTLNQDSAKLAVWLQIFSPAHFASCRTKDCLSHNNLCEDEVFFSSAKESQPHQSPYFLNFPLCLSTGYGWPVVSDCVVELRLKTKSLPISGIKASVHLEEMCLLACFVFQCPFSLKKNPFAKSLLFCRCVPLYSIQSILYPASVCLGEHVPIIH